MNPLPPPCKAVKMRRSNNMSSLRGSNNMSRSSITKQEAVSLITDTASMLSGMLPSLGRLQGDSPIVYRDVILPSG